MSDAFQVGIRGFRVKNLHGTNIFRKGLLSAAEIRKFWGRIVYQNHVLILALTKVVANTCHGTT